MRHKGHILCQKRASPQNPPKVARVEASGLGRRSSSRLFPSEVRRNGRGVCVARYYDPSTGQFLSVDPAVSQTQAPFNYAGDDPVNAIDPSGQSGQLPFAPNACFGTEPGVPAAGQAALCWAQKAVADGLTGKALQQAGGDGIACSGSYSPTTSGTTPLVDLGFSFSLPAVVIPVGPFVITLQDQVTVSGSDSPVNVTLADDGSFTIGSGGSTANFSSEDVLEGLTDGDWTYSGDDITYSEAVTENVGPHEAVTTNYSATLSLYNDHLPPGALGVDVEHGVEVAGAVAAGAGVLALVLPKLGCLVLGPDPAAAVCAIAVP
jgi:RHS repeat-associated protein